MRFFNWAKLAVISSITALLLGEIIFWVLLLLGTFIIISSGNPSGDAGLMISFFYLGFCFRPIISAFLAIIVYAFLAFRNRKDINHRNYTNIVKIALSVVFVVIFVVGSSIVIVAAEAEIPLTEIFKIYMLFIR